LRQQHGGPGEINVLNVIIDPFWTANPSSANSEVFVECVFDQGVIQRQVVFSRLADIEREDLRGDARMRKGVEGGV
jgi:hypothetical protein